MLMPIKEIIKRIPQTQLITQVGDKTMTVMLPSIFMTIHLFMVMDGDTLITTFGAGTMGGL